MRKHVLAPQNKSLDDKHSDTDPQKNEPEEKHSTKADSEEKDVTVIQDLEEQPPEKEHPEPTSTPAPTTILEAIKIPSPTCTIPPSPSPPIPNKAPSTGITPKPSPSTSESPEKNPAWYFNPSAEYPWSLLQPIDGESNWRGTWWLQVKDLRAMEWDKSKPTRQLPFGPRGKDGRETVEGGQDDLMEWLGRS